MLTASVAEWLWSLICILGILANARLIWLTLRKRRAALLRGAVPAGPRILTANRYLRNDACRAAFFFGGLIVGLWALAILDETWWFSVFATWVLICMAGVMLGASVFDLADERNLDKLIQQESRKPRL